MSDPRTDRRVIRTKMQIRQALIELLMEKSEKNISVRELAQRAGINRGTFYIHYKDTHDLVEQLVNEAAEKICSVCLRHPPANTPKASYPFLTDLFETLQTDPQLFSILLSSRGSHAYAKRICKVIQENFLDTLLEQFYSADVKQIKVASGFIVSGCLNEALIWLERGMPETPD